VVGWYREGHPLVDQYQKDVTFTGLRDDVPAILSKTDLFVLPSYSEGLSNALMEAMSSSCACIASDVGGNRFLIQNGVSGFLFPAGDREALRSHIRRLLDDPAKRSTLGQTARTRIEEYFSWEAIGRQYERFFQDFLQL
jgi:glycosyltransferase involved in cell wall biosynthesis